MTFIFLFFCLCLWVCVWGFLSASRSMANCCVCLWLRKISLRWHLCWRPSFYIFVVCRQTEAPSGCALCLFPRISNVGPVGARRSAPIACTRVPLYLFSACRRVPTSRQRLRMMIMNRDVGYVWGTGPRCHIFFPLCRDGPRRARPALYHVMYGKPQRHDATSVFSDSRQWPP